MGINYSWDFTFRRFYFSMVKKLFLGLLLGIFLISLSSANILCSPNQVSIEYQTGTTQSQTASIQCSNSGNSSISVSENGDYFSIDLNSINDGATKTINLDFDENAPEGNHFNAISFGDGTNIPIFMSITSPPIQSGCFIDIFPQILTNVKVKQGETKTRNIQLTLPSCYTHGINVQGVILQSDEKPIQLGELTLGTIQPGNSIQIPIEIDATDVSTGIYTDSLLFSVFNASGEKLSLPSVSVSIIVTSSISPDTTEIFNSPPSCSLSSTNLVLNQSYSLTCSNVNNNLDVNIPYSEYYEGIGVDKASGIYTYNFKPVKHGNTNFLATFTYIGATLFQPFNSEIRISSTGSNVAGTSLKFSFTPELNKLGDGEEVLIQLIDNKTGNLVESPEIEIDALLLNKTGNSFKYSFKAEKEYSIRGKASGYDDLVETIKIEPQFLEYIINPTTGITTDTFVSINVTNAENTTIFIDGVKKADNSYYNGRLVEGENQIEFIHPDFKNTKTNLTVEQSLRIVSGYSVETFKKGVEQSLVLNKNASWKVLYKKDISSTPETEYSGLGDNIKFKVDKNGIWIIEADDKQLGNYAIENNSIFSWIKDNLIYIVGVLVLIGLGFYFIKQKRGDDSLTPMSARINQGY